MLNNGFTIETKEGFLYYVILILIFKNIKSS